MTEENKSPITVQNDLIGTDTTLTVKAPAEVPPVDLQSIKNLVAAAGANPALLVFPQDKWGFTSKVKTAVLQAASSVRGQDDKHDLLIGTLAVLIAHIRARKEGDKQTQAMVRASNEAAAAERGPRERTTGRVVNNTEVILPSE